MARLSHRLEYLAARTGAGLVRMLTPRMADGLGAGLGRAAHLLLASRRKVAAENLIRATGIDLTDKEREVVVRAVFENIGRMLVEFARFGKTGLEGARKICFGDREDIFHQVHAEGKGAVCVSAHFGNWELLGSWVATIGLPIDFLVGEQHNLLVDEMLVNFRREMGVGIIPLKHSLRGVFKALKAGHMVGLVADQHDPSSGLVIDFFGRPAAASRGPALFAMRAGCPVIPFLLRRERYDRHVVMAGNPIYPPRTGDDEADIKTITDQYSRFFELGIQAYPDQWLWTHRRWKL